MNDNTTLKVTASGESVAVVGTDMTFGSSGTGTVTLGFANPSSATTAPISSSGGLTVNDPVTVNITGSITFTGTYLRSSNTRANLVLVPSRLARCRRA